MDAGSSLGYVLRQRRYLNNLFGVLLNTFQGEFDIHFEPLPVQRTGSIIDAKIPYCKILQDCAYILLSYEISSEGC